MRILHVVASGQRRGAEMFAADLIRALRDDGVEQRAAILRPDGMAVDYGVPVLPLGPARRIVPGLRVDSRGVGLLRSVLRSWDPDVVQAHGGDTLKHLLAATGGRGPAGLVYRSIGLAPAEARRGPRRAVWSAICRRAERVVAVAEVVRREAVETFRVEPTRVVTIPNAVDPMRLQPSRGRDEVRAELELAPSAEVVLSLGALTWEKDPLAQVQVGARVLARRPKAVLLLVGDGPLRAQVERRVARLGLSGRIRTLGNRPDVPALLAASDMLLLASATEGMPACVIEAGLLEVPVAGYAVGGVPEVVAHGVTGLLAPLGDEEALAGATIDLLSDPNGRTEMGRAARERCATRHDIRDVAPAYVRLYKEVAR
jgi:glycosyltransferase involved in cell wall biosynthesis